MFPRIRKDSKEKSSIPRHSWRGFFIHGEDDTFNPPYMAYELYDATKSEKELWLVPGAEHGKAFDINPEEYFIKIRTFYNKYIN